MPTPEPRQWCGHHGDVRDGQCIDCIAGARDRLRAKIAAARIRLHPGHPAYKHLYGTEDDDA